MKVRLNQFPFNKFTKKQPKKTYKGKRQYSQYDQHTYEGYVEPSRKMKMLLPKGMKKLSEYIFDCRSKGTYSKNNLDKLSLYASIHYEYGGDIANMLRNLCDMVLVPQKN